MSNANLIPIYQHRALSGTDRYYCDAQIPNNYGWSNGTMIFRAYQIQEPRTIPIYRHQTSFGIDRYYYDTQIHNNYGWKDGVVLCYAYSTPQPGTIPIYIHSAGDPDRYFLDNLPYNNYGWSAGDVLCYAFPPTTTYGLRSWMADPVIQSKTLYDITLPATHDSGAYELGWEITTDSNCGTKALGSYGDLFKLLVGIASGTAGINIPIILLPLRAALMALGAGGKIYVTGLAQAQALTLKEQLEGGIRALDLRVCADSAGVLRTAHSLIGNKIDDLLNDVNDFLKETSNELVIVDLGVGTTTNTGNYRSDLTTMIRTKFGNKIIPNNGSVNLKQTSLAALTTSGSRVLFTINDSNNVNDIFWPGLYVAAPGNSTWNNPASYKLDQIESAQNTFLTSASFNDMNNLVWTLTPNSDYITSSLLNASLYNLSTIINPELKSFLSKKITPNEQNKIRRISCDFFHQSEAVAVAILLSQGQFITP